MKKVLNTIEDIKSATIKALSENGKWMTANEIINWAHANGYMESKNAPRQAMSHPIYRTLTSMMRSEEDLVYGLERRVRENGLEKGSYEYAYKGLYDGTKVIINGQVKSKIIGEKVEIGGKTYSKNWLETHPDKWAMLVENANKPKTLLEKIMEG